MFLTREKIHVADFCQTPEDLSAGAEVVFLGKVRNHSNGERVLWLEYEAYAPMAEKLIEECVQRTYLRWPVTSVRILHRLGRVELGEIAVAIQVGAVHRDEAYCASRFLIETIKHWVPIWKKEYFEDGTSGWSLCRHLQEVSVHG